MNVAGLNISRARLSVHEVGPWVLEIDVDEADPVLTGKVSVELPGATLTGTVDEASDTHQQRGHYTLLGGADGWSKVVPAKHYGRVATATVVQDLARAAGETIGTLVPVASSLAAFTRLEQRASISLQAAIGSAKWWVDYQGVTHVGPRTSAKLGKYQVLAYDPPRHTLELSLPDLSELRIGSTVDQLLDRTLTIVEYEVSIDARGITAVCRTGTADTTLAGLLHAIIDQRVHGTLSLPQEYRVIRMNGDRVDLQITNKQVGYPDMAQVQMAPGLAGCHAQLQPGAHVVVQWIAGNRERPIITHFAGKDGVGFDPVSLVLGGATGAAAARVGDAVEFDPEETQQITLVPVSSATGGGLYTMTLGPNSHGSNRWRGSIVTGSDVVSIK